MYNDYRPYTNPYYSNQPMYNPYGYRNIPMQNPDYLNQNIDLRDYGPEPFVVNIEKATIQNNTFRTALWTGENLQLTLMSIEPGDDIGLEMHSDVDQFIRIEEGRGFVMMGDSRDNLQYQQRVYDDYSIFVPAGKWHNLINTGYTPLKLYSIYAPPEHPRGTVHETKEDAQNHHEY